MVSVSNVQSSEYGKDWLQGLRNLEGVKVTAPATKPKFGEITVNRRISGDHKGMLSSYGISEEHERGLACRYDDYHYNGTNPDGTNAIKLIA